MLGSMRLQKVCLFICIPILDDVRGQGFRMPSHYKERECISKKINVIAIPFYMLPYLPFKDDVFQWFLVAL